MKKIIGMIAILLFMLSSMLVYADTIKDQNSTNNGGKIVTANQYLYPGEKIIKADGYPALVKFIKGNPNKPLIIFIPGYASLARLSYGFPGCKENDFLSYWLHKEGYSFLGISYPVKNKVFSKVYPDFTVTEWGKQTADIAKLFVDKYKLNKHIIVAAWSMGGRIAPSINIAAKKEGLNIKLFVALSSIPPIPGFTDMSFMNGIRLTPKGLADMAPLIPWFIKCIKIQDNINGHIIIPSNIYKTQFMGDTPTNLMVGKGSRFINGKWTRNYNAYLSDTSALNLKDYPLVGIIHDVGIYNLPVATQASIFNQSNWGFIIEHNIFNLITRGNNLNKLTPAEWKKLTKTVNDAPNNMTKTIHGTHFFFVGEKGAKATAKDISILISKVNNYKKYSRHI